jgi:hypothetical protein
MFGRLRIAATVISSLCQPYKTIHRTNTLVVIVMLWSSLMIFSATSALAQTPIEFWPTSLNSNTPGVLELQSSRWTTSQSYFSPDLLNQPPGDYLIQAFEAPTSLPNSSFFLSGASMTLGMAQPTGTLGSLYPEIKVFLNGPTGTPICSMTSDTALPPTIASIYEYSLSCAAASNIQSQRPIPIIFGWVFIQRLRQRYRLKLNLL